MNYNRDALYMITSWFTYSGKVILEYWIRYLLSHLKHWKEKIKMGEIELKKGIESNTPIYKPFKDGLVGSLV